MRCAGGPITTNPTNARKLLARKHLLSLFSLFGTDNEFPCGRGGRVVLRPLWRRARFPRPDCAVRRQRFYGGGGERSGSGTGVHAHRGGAPSHLCNNRALRSLPAPPCGNVRGAKEPHPSFHVPEGSLMFRHGRAKLSLALALVGAVWLLTGPQGAGGGADKRLKVGQFALSGPQTHDNLTVFLVHGPDELKGRKFLMLADALAQKKFVIHETQKVNDLTMENLSDTEVIILSGDILKGGQQDRIAQYDQVVPP